MYNNKIQKKVTISDNNKYIAYDNNIHIKPNNRYKYDVVIQKYNQVGYLIWIPS
jgi:hypothetical protein